MPNILQVSEYLTLVNEALKIIPLDHMVEGEVSDFRIAQDKWVSFDLKDEQEQAVLKCFMTTWQLKCPVEDGMRVRVAGYPKIYERFGTFKMNVQAVEPVGEGALRRAYELLKKKLQAEGLFDLSRKRALPRFVNRIGLISSRDAAAYGDFLQILNNRWGGVLVDFVHVHVQGREAVSDLLGAFAYFNGLPAKDRPEVLVMTRGGGGLEDLHAFNDEAVARAVFSSKVPVVCAVGHERDESLCDYVADVRASTPSNAAERVVPSRDEVRLELSMMTNRLADQLEDKIAFKNQIITEATQAIDHYLSGLSDRLAAQLRILKNLDPKRVLSRGYSIVTSAGQVIKDTAKLDKGTEIAVQLASGQFEAVVVKRETWNLKL
ncbi:exodeoxyribonuclease VII large subunit [Patescibacteria group bacterium]